MIYVISKSTYGSYAVRDIQCNANWDCCPYSDYALIPDNLVDGILATKGYCDITLNGDGNMVTAFTAREIPAVPEECCGTNTVLSVNGAKANNDGEIYLPQNIADNSDWSNPVNQRGQTVYDAGAHTIDRWYAAANGASNVLQLNNGYITMSTHETKFKGLVQRYENNTLSAGEAYTVAVWLLDGSVLVGHNTISLDNSSVGITMGEKLQATLAHNSFDIILWNNADRTITYNIKHIGLYKGVFTAETLPEYQPKGYEVELAECQRYYQKVSFDNSHAIGHCAIGSGAVNVPLTMKFPMRITNPTISGQIDALAPEGWQGAQEPTLSSSISGFVANVSIKSGFTFETGKSCLVKGSIELSADLL